MNIPTGKEDIKKYKGSCHCGAIQFELSNMPEWLVSCNCSICTRLGAIWAHAETTDVELIYDEDTTIAYSWGEQTLAFHTCTICGCTTHWENLDNDKYSRMGINFLMCTDHDILEFRIRKLDGADTWKFIGEADK